MAEIPNQSDRFDDELIHEVERKKAEEELAKRLEQAKKKRTTLARLAEAIRNFTGNLEEEMKKDGTEPRTEKDKQN